MSDAVTIDLIGRDQSLSSALSDGEKMAQEFMKSVVNSMKEVQNASHGADQLGQSVKGSDAATGDWLGTLSKIGNIVSGVKAGYDMFMGALSTGIGIFQQYVDLASKQEDVNKRLEHQMRGTGNASGWAYDQIDQLASSLQNVSNFGDDATKSAARVLVSFQNIRGDVFVDTIKSAQDLAAATGGDLNGAVQKLGKALDDPIKGLTALRGEGIAFRTETEELVKSLVAEGKVMEAQQIILDGVRDRFGGMAQEMAGTWSGVMANATNRIGDMQEAIGDMLIPHLKELQPLFDHVATAVENLIPIVGTIIETGVRWGKEWIAALMPTFEWIVDGTVEAFSFIQVSIERFNDFVGFIGASVAHAIVKMYNEIVYYFTDVIPGILKWFGENWMSIFKDIFNFQATILQNMGKNIWDFILYVKDLLTGNGGSFKFTALLDGFELTIKELPAIAQRMEGELEKSLRKTTQGLADSLGADIAERTAQNKQALLDLFKKKSGPEKPLEVGEFSKEFDIAKLQEEKVKEGKEKAEKNDKGDKADKVSFESLDSLGKRIQLAAAGTPQDKVEKAVNAAAAQEAEKLDKLATVVKDASDKQIANLADLFNDDDKPAKAPIVHAGFGGGFNHAVADVAASIDAAAAQMSVVTADADAIVLERIDQRQARRDGMLLDSIKALVDSTVETRNSTKKLADAGLTGRYSG